METLVEKNNKIVEHTVSKLQEETVYVFKEIWEFANFNEYQYNKHPQYNEDDLMSMIGKLSLNQRKKLKKRINIFRTKQTLSTANRFYHFIYSRVLKVDMRVKLTHPIKHLLIQKKRQVFLKLQTEMEAALKDYKSEKKDYYNARLQREQKVS